MNSLNFFFKEYYSKEKNYFRITTISAGLGDELSQLERLYRLGNAMGFQFLYTPLQHKFGYHTNDSGENLFDEFNLGWEEEIYDYRKVWKLKKRNIHLEKLLKKTGIDSLSDLKDYLLNRYGTGNLFNFVFNWEINKKYNLSKHFIEKIDTKYTFPIKEKYWMNREKLNSEKTIICVHVRRGDMTFFQMEDGLYFGLFFRKLTKTIEEVNPLLNNKYIPTVNVLRKIEELIPTLDKPYQIYLLTDGIDVAYKYSKKYYRKLRKYFDSPTQMLNVFQDKFDKEMSLFNNLEHCEMLCGTYDYELTKRSIYYLASADIIITPPWSEFSIRIPGMISEKTPKYLRVK